MKRKMKTFIFKEDKFLLDTLIIHCLSGFRFTRHCLVFSLVMWPVSKISAKLLWVPGQILLSCAIRTVLAQVMRMCALMPRFKWFQIFWFLSWYRKNPVKRSQGTQIMNIHIHANFYKVVIITGREDVGGGVISLSCKTSILNGSRNWRLRLVQKKRHNGISRTLCSFVCSVNIVI